ncbi:hypothetical protein ACWEP5_36530 [Nocardia niigatensis]
MLDDIDNGHPTDPMMPPYVAALHHRFGEQAHAVRFRLKELIKSLDAQRITALDQITVIDHRLARVRAQLDTFPVDPPAEMLTRRNSIERGKPDELIAARNQREWHARRRLHEQDDANLAARRQALHDQVAVFNGKITAAERAAQALIQRRHELVGRRGRAYQRHLVLRHRGGAAVLAVLDFTPALLPALGDNGSEHGLAPAPFRLSEHVLPGGEHTRQKVIGA